MNKCSGVSTLDFAAGRPSIYADRQIKLILWRSLKIEALSSPYRMVLITGIFLDSGGVPIASGGLTVKLDAPIIDVTTVPDSLYTQTERSFPIVNGLLPTIGSTQGITLPQTATKNTTYSFTVYQTTTTPTYYFQDGRYYDGIAHLFSDGFYWSGVSHSAASIRLDRVDTSAQTIVIATFHSIVPNVAQVDFAQLLPVRVATDKLPTTIRELAEVLVNTPQYLALLTQAKWQGVYNPLQLYAKYDEVFYSGSSWIFINSIPTVGQTPSTLNTTYWNVRVAKGDPGGTGGQDTPFDPTGWDGQTWAPTANVLRDYLITLATQAQLVIYAPKATPQLTAPTLLASPANSDRSLAIPSTQWVGGNFATIDGAILTGNIAVPLQATADRSNKPSSTQWVDNYFVSKNLVNSPYFIARKTTLQTLISGFNVLTYDSKLADTNNAFNLTTGTFTIPALFSGLYELTHGVVFQRTAGAAIYDVYTQVLVNGVVAHNIEYQSGINTTGVFLTGTKMFYLNAGDTAQFRCFVTLNGNTIVSDNTTTNNMLTECSGKKLLT